jgi:Glycosyl transferase family 2
MLGVAVFCVLVLGYTYLGYPMLIGLLARLRPRPTHLIPGWEPTVTVCVAAYNVALTLDAKIASLLAQRYPRDKLEILVYSDGSTDGTDDLVRLWAQRDPRVRLLRGTRRQGKPTGLNRMREAARGEVLLITDARQPLAPGALRALLDVLADPGVGSVVGMTGPIAALRKSDLGLLPADLILDDVWIPMRLRLRGRKVLFAEDAIAYDRAFEDDREFARKVRTLAGNYQIFARMPALLSPAANPSWFETVSHKVMRLVCPWALLTLFLASAAGLAATDGAVGWQLLFGAQIAFYGAAIIGRRAGKVAGVARTFLVLHVAALVGLYRYLTGQQKVTW